MIIEENVSYTLYGMVCEFNDSLADTYPVVFQISNDEKVVLRCEKGTEICCGEMYKVTGTGIKYKTKNHIQIEKITLLKDCDMDDKEKDEIISSILGFQKINHEMMSKYIENELDSLNNQVIKDIALYIYNNYREQFIDYPAATKFHHAFKHGLLLHTYNSLRLVKMYIKIYPNINSDLAIAGIILHDIMKIKEINAFRGEYTMEGKLLGHITMAGEEVYKVASILGYEDKEEALLLNHIMISHHYESDFGSPRKPQIIEALIVHLADLADAKIEPVIEALEKTEIGSMTDQIPVCEKIKFYKHGL